MKESTVENPNFDMIVNFVWNFEPERKYHICWIIHHYPLWLSASTQIMKWFMICFVFFFYKLQFSASKIQLHKRGLRSSFGPLQNSFSFSNLQNKTMQNFRKYTKAKTKIPSILKTPLQQFRFPVICSHAWPMAINNIAVRIRGKRARGPFLGQAEN